MSFLHRPVWSQGLALTPQHFQASDRYHEAALDARIAAVTSHPWGIVGLRLQSNQIASGTVALESIEAIWPDGTCIAADASGGGLPPARSVEEVMGHAKQTLGVYLGIRRPRGNQNTYGSDVGKSKYLVSPARTSDENGEADEVMLDLARPNIVLLFEGEDREDYSAIKIAEVTRSLSGSFAFVDNFIPSTPTISASQHITASLRRMLSSVHTRRMELLKSRREDAGSIQFHARDLTRFLLLNTLNQKAPLFEHFLDVQRQHPIELYQHLAELAGSLCTFSSDVQIESIPKFDFLNLRDTFDPLFNMITEMVSVNLDAGFLTVDLTGRKDGIHLGDISDDDFLSCRKFFLSIRSDLSSDEVAALVPRFCKLSAYGDAPALIAAAASGIPITHITELPDEVPMKVDQVYFSIDETNEYWSRLVKDRRISLFMPSQFSHESNKVQVIAIH